MKLTPDEKKWIAKLQAVLDACPSKRLGFYTIGDPTVSIYDHTKEAKIDALMRGNDNLDFPGAVDKAGADCAEWIRFPRCVHSVAG